jgi:Holliday junction resolvase RusA-like endonuclease
MWSFGPVEIKGHLALKSNGRRIIFRGQRRPRSIKSEAALMFAATFATQIRRPKEAFAGPVALFADVWYADKRRDLDISLLQDAIQDAGIIVNDRAILEIHARRFIDKMNPRVKFKLVELETES